MASDRYSSSWQKTRDALLGQDKFDPKFTRSLNLSDCVDTCLRGHEDYMLMMHDIVESIIQSEIERFYAGSSGAYKVEFKDLCNWQYTLQKEKLSRIESARASYEEYEKHKDDPEINIGANDMMAFAKIAALPNQYINYGLRKCSVQVGNHTPPAHVMLPNLLTQCFPATAKSVIVADDPVQFLKEWYVKFQHNHYFEDLNGRLGFIFVNIMMRIASGVYIKIE